MKLSGWPCLSILLITVVLVGCQATVVPPAPQFDISTNREGNTVVYQLEGETAVFVVNSDTGIGSAEISLTSGEMPDQMRLRFYLQGLEEMKFAYGETAVSLGISSHGNNESWQTVQVEGEEITAVSPDSPYTMQVQITPDGSSIPLKEGYIEITPPADFLQSGQTSFTINWVDFYR